MNKYHKASILLAIIFVLAFLALLFNTVSAYNLIGDDKSSDQEKSQKLDRAGLVNKVLVPTLVISAAGSIICVIYGSTKSKKNDK